MPMYPRQPLDHIHTPLQRQSPRIDPVAPHPSKVVMDAEEFAIVSAKFVPRRVKPLMSYDEAQNDEVEVLVGPPGGWVAAIIVKILYISNRLNFTVAARFEVKYTSPKGKLVQEAVSKERIRATPTQ